MSNTPSNSETQAQENPAVTAPHIRHSNHQEKAKGSSFGVGFLLGLAVSLILAAYPLYLAFFSQQSQEEAVNQAIIDTMQMQITLAYKELESVERQLEMIAEAESRYQALVEQRFDLETTQAHLNERIDKLENNLKTAEQELGVEANQFDRITEGMRLE